MDELVARAIEKLPNQTVQQTVKVWLRALTILADDEQRNRYGDLRALLDEIGTEWVRRSEKTLDPDEMVAWPTADSAGGGGRLMTDDWLSKGMVSFLEYRVGITNGLAAPVRKQLLTQIYTGKLPPVFPSWYLSEWGKPGAPRRLAKLAGTIAQFARNEKCRAGMSVAIEHRRQDLEFLYYNYYVNKLYLGWPTVEWSRTA
jgi:hypothetical protein